MPRGGARPGAGRKSKSRELLIERSRNAAVTARITPLEYLLQIVQDTSASEDRRFAAAIAAAPYVHPRLSNATVTTKVTRGVQELSTAELMAALEATQDEVSQPEPASTAQNAAADDALLCPA
jgi:hypothetical protein